MSSLRQQSEWLRGTLDSIADGVITTNREGLITSVNLVAQRLTGWTELEAMNRPLPEVFQIISDGPEGSDGAVALHAPAPGQFVTLAGQATLIAKDGCRRAIDNSIAPIRDASGRMLGSIVIFRDATAERESHAALQHLAAVIASSDDAIITKDLTGRITTWNDGASRIFGYSADEAVGQSITMLIPAERHPEEENILQRLRQGERVMPFETVRIHKTGRRLDISVTSSPIHDASGRVIGASKIARDISERVRRERITRFLSESSSALADLRDYESTLRQVARLAVPSFADICAVDILMDDGSARRLTLVQTNDGGPEDIMRQHPPRLTDAHGAMRVLRTGESVWVPEVTDEFLQQVARNPEHLEWLRALGFLSYMCVPVRSRRSAVAALTFATTAGGRTYDETDLQVAEDVASRAAIAIENASLVTTLQESDRRKDEFLAMLAHELRNPLAPIRNAAQIIRLQAPAGAEFARATEMIDRQVHQMTRLVDDLLDVSRIQTGKIALHAERIDAREVAESVVEVVQQQMATRRHQLVVALPVSPVLVMADPLRLGQVLFNLLDNAAKYTDQHGQIRLTMTADGAVAAFSVRDTGVGIAPEMLTRIFEMFTQVDRSLDRSQGGLGIGLMLVRSLVEMHGGHVSARSEGPGMGSEFVVELPLA